MNFFLPHICIFLVLFKSVSVDAQNQFHPFLLHFVSGSFPNSYRIPLDKIPSTNDPNMRIFCPAETDQDKSNLNILSATFPQAKYCLFWKKVPSDQPKYCTEQPKPWLTSQSQHTKDEGECGTSPEHRRFGIGFYVFGTWKHLEDFQKKPDQPHLVARFQKVLEVHASGRSEFPQFHKIYDLCIDTSNGKTIWTKHDIMTPNMFTDDEEKLQRESGGDTEISTDPILFEANTFINLKQKFLSQNEESIKMTENFMVPREHVALRVWRNAVNHYINVAPLWDNLKKLMITVNQAIKKIGLHLEANGQWLTIYNKAIDSKNEDGTTIQVNSQFSSTVWYKLLYDKTSYVAALIVLHNTPDTPPKIKECKIEMACDVKKWYEKKQDDVEGISDEVFEYVYCCNPTTSEVLKLFNFKHFIKGPLNLDDFF
ncbi:uncharacterized protein LOC135842587 [Planococcus citri]|uniref:uncharacterized protein LOC135842587 n=1 Tax=Planococcus citri TaxID=170843 RepID=UPI0031F9FBC6